MQTPFDSPRLLIEEAEESIARVEQNAEAFFSHKDIVVGTEIDPKSREHLFYAQYPIDMPARISLDVRAAARDLRDALDHAIYASAVTLKGGEPGKTKFLVADTAEGIKDDIRRNRCKDVHESIISLMESEHAYKAGNVALWTLNQLRNTNTHKVVTLAHADVMGFGINDGFMTGTFTTISDWRSTRRRLYFGRLTPDAQFDCQISCAAQICLQPIYATPSESAASYLRRVSADVRRIVDAVEMETVKLKR